MDGLSVGLHQNYRKLFGKGGGGVDFCQYQFTVNSPLHEYQIKLRVFERRCILLGKEKVHPL
jgi:hypothetical protein